jgi:hypothetical protein
MVKAAQLLADTMECEVDRSFLHDARSTTAPLPLFHGTPIDKTCEATGRTSANAPLIGHQMELVTILRELWRLRVLVIVAGLIALLVGFAVAFRLPSLESRKYEVGVATASLLVDTPNSQVVEVAPKGSDTLGVRANLIANLMAEGVVKTAIAERAGIAPEKLEGVAESAGGPPVVTGASKADAHVLTTRVVSTFDGDRLPIIEIEAQAPDAAQAAKLADAAITGLRDYLDSKAASEQVPDADRLRVSGLGSPQARDVVRGPKNIFAVAAVIFVFALGCGAILGTLALIRGWRVAAAMDDEPLDWGAEDNAQNGEIASFDELFDDRSFVSTGPERSDD